MLNEANLNFTEMNTKQDEKIKQILISLKKIENYM